MNMNKNIIKLAWKEVDGLQNSTSPVVIDYSDHLNSTNKYKTNKNKSSQTGLWDLGQFG